MIADALGPEGGCAPLSIELDAETGAEVDAERWLWNYRHVKSRASSSVASASAGSAMNGSDSQSTLAASRRRPNVDARTTGGQTGRVGGMMETMRSVLVFLKWIFYWDRATSIICRGW